MIHFQLGLKHINVIDLGGHLDNRRNEFPNMNDGNRGQLCFIGQNNIAIIARFIDAESYHKHYSQSTRTACIGCLTALNMVKQQHKKQISNFNRNNFKRFKS